MNTFLSLIGFVGFFVSLIFLIIYIIKKKEKKRVLVSMAICFVLFVAGVAMTDTESSTTSSNSEDESKTESQTKENKTQKETEEKEEEIPIHPDELEADITIRKPDSIGTVYMDATYTNNSEYPIVAYELNVLLKDKNEKVSLSNFDTVMPGETSPKFDSFGPETQDPNDYELLGLEVTAKKEDGTKLYIEYDFKLEEAEWWESGE
ncbi:hypothetical protein GOQ29_14385 [Clostridium sp. D2Q-14]|uniref:hypothetical protein n=1 Tax=Anaeromonas gelatinilytica TaxID=2683194 RepID=UPI00193BF2D0|nr:hypothetical protein [Anaeromonas gelatinilytica]MBS4536805.1 hypothetical protein [Anaeromonas gelatinilytica]